MCSRPAIWYAKHPDAPPPCSHACLTRVCSSWLFAFVPQNKKLSHAEAMTASLAGGILSAFVTLPIDVLVAQIQQASKAGQRVSVITLIADEFKAGGWERVAGFATRVRESAIEILE